MRWDKSFAYDLVDYHGPVSCRQALLFGSAEGKPSPPVARFSPKTLLYIEISRGFISEEREREREEDSRSS